MALDPIRVRDTHAWFVRARTDLRAAEIDLTASPPILTDVAFHCQQAIEKALKGLLTWHDVSFRKTHDLVESGRHCTVLEPGLDSILRGVGPLTEYAWQFRYPGDEESPPEEEVQQALLLGRNVVAAVLDRPPSEVRPAT